MGILDQLNSNGTAKTEARTARSGGNNANRSDLPKAKFWMNVGYEVDGRFVNIPLGIPLDTQEPLRTDTNNEEFNELRASQNELLEDLMAEAEKMQPGEERIVPLQIRLRRVTERVAADPTTSRFARKERGPLTMAVEPVPAGE